MNTLTLPLKGSRTESAVETARALLSGHPAQSPALDQS